MRFGIFLYEVSIQDPEKELLSLLFPLFSGDIAVIHQFQMLADPVAPFLFFRVLIIHLSARFLLGNLFPQ